MGKLKDLRLPTADISTSGGSITVRGLTLVDITTLVRGRFDEVASLFDKYVPQEGASSLNTEAIGRELIDTAPEIAAYIIALAADGDEDDAGIAMKLPFPVQIEALEAIGKLTFGADGGPKKVLETVIRIAKHVTGLVRDARASEIGSLVTGAKSASS